MVDKKSTINSVCVNSFIDKINKLDQTKKEQIACVLSYLFIIMNDAKGSYVYTPDGILRCLNDILSPDMVSVSDVRFVLEMCTKENEFTRPTTTYSVKLNTFFTMVGINSPNRYAGIGDSQRLVRITKLLKCKFNPVNLSLAKKQLRNILAKITILCGQCDFFGFDFSNLDFSGMDLSHLNFSWTNLSNTIFINSNLYRTNFEFSNLQHANFQKANLLQSNLYGANLEAAYLYNAILDGVNFEQTHVNFMKIKLCALIIAHLPDLQRVDVQCKNNSEYATLVYTTIDHSAVNKKLICGLKEKRDMLETRSHVIDFIFNKIRNDYGSNGGKRRIEKLLNHLKVIAAIKFPECVSDFVFFSSSFILRIVLPGLAKHDISTLAKMIVDLAKADVRGLQGYLAREEEHLATEIYGSLVKKSQSGEVVDENDDFYKFLNDDKLPILVRILACYPLPNSLICSLRSSVIRYPEIKQLDLLEPDTWWIFIIDRAISIEVYREYSPLTFDQEIGGNDGKNYIQSFLDGIRLVFLPEFDLSQFWILNILHSTVKGELKAGITGEQGVYNPCRGFYYNLQKYISEGGMQKLQRNVVEFNPFISILGGEHVYVGAFSAYPSENKVQEIYNDIYRIYSEDISRARTGEDKKRAIILFISRVEISHFFTNCNSRICCQILLNRLLTEHNFPPCILAIPNGFSHQVILEYSANPELSDSLAILAEGQRFYARLALMRSEVN